MTKIIRVLLVDDHAAFRMGMRVLLQQSPVIEIVGEAETGKMALAQLPVLQPDVVVLDCHLPDLDGPTVAAALKKHDLTVHILALSAYDDAQYVRGMLYAGATGYLLKNEATETIVAAVQAAAQGKAYFSAAVALQLAKLAGNNEVVMTSPTAREQEVLQQLAKGLTNAEIARALNIKERTVAFHVENLLSKLGVSNRTEAVVASIRQGWLKV
ncbi:MAG: response regulator transcription factor [Chloroflexi bacterium]|nr:response regulator transcription factor [Chloroflexota bacterium]